MTCAQKCSKKLAYAEKWGKFNLPKIKNKKQLNNIDNLIEVNGFVEEAPRLLTCQSLDKMLT